MSLNFALVNLSLFYVAYSTGLSEQYELFCLEKDVKFYVDCKSSLLVIFFGVFIGELSYFLNTELFFLFARGLFAFENFLERD